jgi:hypothetical protein
MPASRPGRWRRRLAALRAKPHCEIPVTALKSSVVCGARAVRAEGEGGRDDLAMRANGRGSHFRSHDEEALRPAQLRVRVHGAEIAAAVAGVRRVLLYI